jgi:hypothetical protein
VDCKLATEDVPLAVVLRFKQRFPGALNPAWELDEGMYEVEFLWRGQDSVEAEFSPDGDWMKSVFPATPADLPAKARAHLDEMRGFRLVDVERTEFSDGTIVFEAEMDGGLVKWEKEFDEAGNLVSEEREGPVLEGPPDE